jgi:hypothetical protein
MADAAALAAALARRLGQEIEVSAQGVVIVAGETVGRIEVLSDGRFLVHPKTPGTAPIKVYDANELAALVKSRLGA